MTTRTTVFLVGGLGNQLHQLSVAQGLAQHQEVELSLALMGDHRHLEIGSAIARSGIGISSEKALHNSLLPTPLIDVHPGAAPTNLLTFPDNAPWMAHIATPTIYAATISALFDEIPDTWRSTTFSTLIHMRLGDYLWPPASARYGILGPQYYAEALKALGSDVADVATDDPTAARRIYSTLFATGALHLLAPGPSIRDFYFMCTASKFVAANSTFSLWAAWYRREMGLGGGTVAPSTLYRKESRSAVAGLGDLEAHYVHPVRLTMRRPWVLSRRISWRGLLW